MKSNSVMMAILMSLLWIATASAMDVKLQWDPNTESDLAGYKVYYGIDDLSNPMQQDITMQSYAMISGLDPDRNYTFAVTAYNTSGLESSYSNVVNILESVSPVVSITVPANNAKVSKTFSISASASDNVGVTKVEFYQDGILKATETAEPYQYSWDTLSAPMGAHTIIAKAYDAAGNVGDSAVSVNVVNDATQPVITNITPVNGSRLSGVVNISADVSDDVGVTMVEFYANGTLLFASNMAPYTYNWNTMLDANGSYALTVLAYDNAGNVGQSSNGSVTVLNDTTAPIVTVFTIPATASSTTVAIYSFSATDNANVTGYMITESATAPAAGASGWSISAPTSFTFSSIGNKTAFAWVRDSAGNVSSSRSASVTIALPDITAPVVSAFTMPTTSSSRTVAITSFTATDNVRVNGYLITESATKPAVGASGWRASAPTSFTFSSIGSKTAYAWGRDAAGNVSSSRSASVNITLPDIKVPVVSSFRMPSSASSKTVAISSFSATDNVRVTGYLITESATKPAVGASGWRASAPTSFTFSSAGRKTAYAWAKDSAGNISSMRSATVNISTITIKVSRKK